MRVRQTRDTRGDMETANIRILPLASVNPRFLVSLMSFTPISFPSVPVTRSFVSRTGPFGTRWERRWCERHGKEMGTRRKRPTFPRSHLVPSSYSRVSMWRELEEINRVTWDPRNERRERRRDECGAVGLFPFPSHSHPSLPRVTHSAAPHSLHSSVREMNGVRRTVTTRGESEKKPRGRDTTRLGKTRERCGEDTIRAVSLPTVHSLMPGSVVPSVSPSPVIHSRTEPKNPDFFSLIFSLFSLIFIIKNPGSLVIDCFW